MGVCMARERDFQVPRVSSVPKEARFKCVKLDNILTHYDFRKVIGHGQFGVVREAVHISHSHRPVAIKSVNKSKIQRSLELIRRELEILQSVDHPNIIKLYEAYEDTKYLHLVTELCTGGDLVEYILESKNFSENQAAVVARKLLHAVNHLRTLGICHRDIKPMNILFSSKEAGAEVKLLDFGLAKNFAEVEKLESMVGTPYYIAPEVIKGTYGSECDVWALGVLFYMMLSGEHPFVGSHLEAIYASILSGVYDFNGKVWQKVSTEAKHLISRMLIVDPRDRISIDDALSHPWFAKNSDTSPTKVPYNIVRALKHKRSNTIVRREAMKVLVRNLRTDEMQDLLSAFRAIDREKTGLITSEALAQSLRVNGYTLASEEVEEIIRLHDNKGRGYINYTDFLIAVVDRKRLTDDDALWAAFKFFDNDNDDKLSYEDISNTMGRLGMDMSPVEIQDFMTAFQDGSLVDFESFKTVINSHSPLSSQCSPMVGAREIVRNNSKGRILLLGND
mmetsp:Transcript_873/g.2105  ORF Transcript_873/g.2105 Transcript_873/m.2105 type:complete len:506 (-) Transcript_873:7312-8829(-)